MIIRGSCKACDLTMSRYSIHKSNAIFLNNFFMIYFAQKSIPLRITSNYQVPKPIPYLQWSTATQYKFGRMIGFYQIQDK